MRGHLRIRSQRAGYRRAGLVFGEDRQLEPSSADIEPGQLMALVADPALRVEGFRGDRYEPIGASDADCEGHASKVLAILRADLEAAPAAPADQPGGDEALKLATALGELETARKAIEELKAQLAAGNAEIDRLTGELTQRDGLIAELQGKLAGHEQKDGEDGGGSSPPSPSPAAETKEAKGADSAKPAAKGKAGGK